MPPIDENSGQYTEMLRITIDISSFQAELGKLEQAWKGFISGLSKIEVPSVSLGAVDTSGIAKSVAEIQNQIHSLSSDVNTTMQGQIQLLEEQVGKISSALGLQVTEGQTAMTEAVRKATAERIQLGEQEAKRLHEVFAQIFAERLSQQEQAERLFTALPSEVQSRTSPSQIRTLLSQAQREVENEAQTEVKIAEQKEADIQRVREQTLKAFSRYVDQQQREAEKEAEQEVKIAEKKEADIQRVREQTLKAFSRYADQQLRQAQELADKRLVLERQAAQQIEEARLSVSNAQGALAESKALVGAPVPFAGRERAQTTTEKSALEEVVKADEQRLADAQESLAKLEQIQAAAQGNITAEDVAAYTKRLQEQRKFNEQSFREAENARQALLKAYASGDEAEITAAIAAAQKEEKARQQQLQEAQTLAESKLKLHENLVKQLERLDQQRLEFVAKATEQEKALYTQVDLGDRTRPATTAEVQARNAQLQAIRNFVEQASRVLQELRSVDASVQGAITKEELTEFEKRTKALVNSLDRQEKAVESSGQRMVATTVRANEQMVNSTQQAAQKEDEARAGVGIKSIKREALEGLVGGSERANQVLSGTLGITEGIAGNVARMTASMAGWVIAWQVATHVLQGFVSLLEVIPKHIEAGFQALAQDQEKAVELQAVIAQTAHLADGFVANFRAAGQAAPEVVDKLREKAAELNLDFDKLVTTFKVLSESGAPGLTHNLQEVVDLSGLILLSFKAVTRSQEDERKIAQEIPTLLSGQIQENARVLELLHLSRDEWLGILNNIRDTRDLLPFMQARLAEFAEAAKEMPDTWASLERQFALFERTVNEDLAAPLFHQLIALAREFNQWLMENREVIRQYAGLIGETIAEFARLVGALLQILTGSNDVKSALVAIVALTAQWLGDVQMTLAALVMTAQVLNAIVTGDFSKISEAWKEYDQKVQNVSQGLAKIRDLQNDMHSGSGIGSVSLDAKDSTDALSKLSSKFDEVRQRAAETRNTLVALDAAHGKSREETAKDVQKSYDDEIKKINELADAAKNSVEGDASRSPEAKASAIEKILQERGQAIQAVRSQQFAQAESAKQSHLVTMEQMVSEHIGRIQAKYKNSYDTLAQEQGLSDEQRAEKQKRLHQKELRELDDFANELRAKARQAEEQSSGFLGIGSDEAVRKRVLEMRQLANAIQSNEEDILKRDTAGSGTQSRETAATFLQGTALQEKLQDITTATKSKVEDLKLAEEAGAESRVRSVHDIIAAYNAEIVKLRELEVAQLAALQADKNLNEQQKQDAEHKITDAIQRDINAAKAAIVSLQKEQVSRALSQLEEQYRTALHKIETEYQGFYSDIETKQKTHQTSARQAADELALLHTQEANDVKALADAYEAKASKVGKGPEVQKFKDQLDLEKEHIDLQTKERNNSADVTVQLELERVARAALTGEIKKTQEANKQALELERQRYDLGLETAKEYAQRRYELELQLQQKLIAIYQQSLTETRNPQDKERIQQDLELAQQRLKELQVRQPGEMQAAGMRDMQERVGLQRQLNQLEIERLQIDNQFETNSRTRLERERAIVGLRERDVQLALQLATHDLAVAAAEGASEEKLKQLQTQISQLQLELGKGANERGALAAQPFLQRFPGESEGARVLGETLAKIVSQSTARKEEQRILESSNKAIRDELTERARATANQIHYIQTQVSAGTAVEGTSEKLKQLQQGLDNLNKLLKNVGGAAVHPELGAGATGQNFLNPLSQSTQALVEQRNALQNLIGVYQRTGYSIDGLISTQDGYKHDVQFLGDVIKELTGKVKDLNAKIKEAVGSPQNPDTVSGLQLQKTPDFIQEIQKPGDIGQAPSLMTDLNNALKDNVAGFSQLEEAIQGGVGGMQRVQDVAVGLAGVFQTVMGSINQFKQAQQQGGTLGGIGSLLSSGPTGALISAIPVAGPIINAVGGVMQMIGGIFEAHAKKIAESIQKDLQNISFNFSISDGNLKQYIQQLQDERNKAIEELSGTKGGSDKLKKILEEIDKELAQAQFQQQQINNEFWKGFMVLRDQNSELGTTLSQLQSITDEANKYLKASVNAQAVQTFINNSLLAIRNKAQDDFLKGEETAIQDAIKLNDLQEQRIDLINQEKMTEFQLLTKDAVQRQLPQAIQIGQELAKQRDSFQKQLTDLNQQIQLQQDKVNAEKQIYKISTDISTLHRQDEELQAIFMDQEIQKLYVAKSLMEGIVKNAQGNMVLSPQLENLLGIKNIFGKDHNGLYTISYGGRPGFGPIPTYSDLLPPGTPGISTQAPLPYGGQPNYAGQFPYLTGYPYTPPPPQPASSTGPTAPWQHLIDSLGDLGGRIGGRLGAELSPTFNNLVHQLRSASTSISTVGDKLSPTYWEPLRHTLDTARTATSQNTLHINGLIFSLQELTNALTAMRAGTGVPRLASPFVTGAAMQKTVNIGGITVNASTNATPQTIAATVSDELYRNLRYGSGF